MPSTLDGSSEADNLIISHQVDYKSSTLILAEAAENEQGYPVAMCCRITSLI